MARDRASRPEAKPLRLFLAVDVPDDVRAAVVDAAVPFREGLPGARWTRSEGWHVTLKFLGATWPRLVEEVAGTVRDVAAGTEAFDTTTTEMGAFPSPARARVLWVGLADPDQRFPRLAGDLDRALAAHFAAEKRPFRPHLTMARLNPPQDLRAVAPGLAGTPVASRRFAVDRIVLYRSHLSPRGATYEALEAFPLASPSPAAP